MNIVQLLSHYENCKTLLQEQENEIKRLTQENIKLKASKNLTK